MAFPRTLPFPGTEPAFYLAEEGEGEREPHRKKESHQRVASDHGEPDAVDARQGASVGCQLHPRDSGHRPSIANQLFIIKRGPCHKDTGPASPLPTRAPFQLADNGTSPRRRPPAIGRGHHIPRPPAARHRGRPTGDNPGPASGAASHPSSQVCERRLRSERQEVGKRDT